MIRLSKEESRGDYAWLYLSIYMAALESQCDCTCRLVWPHLRVSVIVIFDLCGHTSYSILQYS
jgi:hypothetical protein